MQSRRFGYNMAMGTTSKNEFERAAAEERDRSLLGEILEFLRHNKKWWLLPMILVLLFVGLLIMMTGSAAAPFIYTLF